ncbi:unnamed protein product [Calypogeia fissa]
MMSLRRTTKPTPENVMDGREERHRPFSLYKSIFTGEEEEEEADHRSNASEFPACCAARLKLGLESENGSGRNNVQSPPSAGDGLRSLSRSQRWGVFDGSDGDDGTGGFIPSLEKKCDLKLVKRVSETSLDYDAMTIIKLVQTLTSAALLGT